MEEYYDIKCNDIEINYYVASFSYHNMMTMIFYHVLAIFFYYIMLLLYYH